MAPGPDLHLDAGLFEVLGPDGDGSDDGIGVCKHSAGTLLDQRLLGPESVLASTVLHVLVELEREPPQIHEGDERIGAEPGGIYRGDGFHFQDESPTAERGVVGLRTDTIGGQFDPAGNALDKVTHTRAKHCGAHTDLARLFHDVRLPSGGLRRARRPHHGTDDNGTNPLPSHAESAGGIHPLVLPRATNVARLRACWLTCVTGIDGPLVCR